MSTEYGVWAEHYDEPGHVRYINDSITRPQQEVDSLNQVFDTDRYKLVSREVAEWTEVER